MATTLVCPLTVEHLDKAYHRMIERIEFTDGCWLWKGTVSNRGYGSLCVNNIKLLVHRYSFMYFNNTPYLKTTQHIHHRCYNKLCVNPSHLQLVTPSQHGNIKHEIITPTSSEEKSYRKLHRDEWQYYRQIKLRAKIKKGIVFLGVQHEIKLSVTKGMELLEKDPDTLSFRLWLRRERQSS